MSANLPPPFLFRYAFPVRYLEKLPAKGNGLLDLPEDCAVESPAAHLARGTSFADLRLAWNDDGLGISVVVSGRRSSTTTRNGPRIPAEAEGLQVWIDTRDTRSIHRASRYCHHFCLLPTDPFGTSRKPKPTVIQLPIARAREETPSADTSLIQVRAEMRDDGYRLEAWFPAETLNGFDPEASPRLGFYSLIRDDELGEQHLTLGAEFPYAHDPSLWSTLELVR